MESKVFNFTVLRSEIKNNELISDEDIFKMFTYASLNDYHAKCLVELYKPVDKDISRKLCMKKINSSVEQNILDEAFNQMLRYIESTKALHYEDIFTLCTIVENENKQDNVVENENKQDNVVENEQNKQNEQNEQPIQPLISPSGDEESEGYNERNERNENVVENERNERNENVVDNERNERNENVVDNERNEQPIQPLISPSVDEESEDERFAGSVLQDNDEELAQVPIAYRQQDIIDSSAYRPYEQSYIRPVNLYERNRQADEVKHEDTNDYYNDENYID